MAVILKDRFCTGCFDMGGEANEVVRLLDSRPSADRTFTCGGQLRYREAGLTCDASREGSGPLSLPRTPSLLATDLGTYDATADPRCGPALSALQRTWASTSSTRLMRLRTNSDFDLHRQLRLGVRRRSHEDRPARCAVRGRWLQVVQERDVFVHLEFDPDHQSVDWVDTSRAARRS